MGLLAASDQLVDDACRAAYGALDALLLSDAPLLYGPAQLAAAALRSGFKTKGVRVGGWLGGWLSNWLGGWLAV